MQCSKADSWIECLVPKWEVEGCSIFGSWGLNRGRRSQGARTKRWPSCPIPSSPCFLTPPRVEHDPQVLHNGDLPKDIGPRDHRLVLLNQVKNQTLFLKKVFMSDFLLQRWKTKNYSQDSPSFQIPRPGSLLHSPSLFFLHSFASAQQIRDEWCDYLVKVKEVLGELYSPYPHVANSTQSRTLGSKMSTASHMHRFKLESINIKSNFRFLPSLC